MEKKYKDIIDEIAKYAYAKSRDIREEYPNFEDYLKEEIVYDKERFLDGVFMGCGAYEYNPRYEEEPCYNIEFLIDFMEEALPDGKERDFAELCKPVFEHELCDRLKNWYNPCYDGDYPTDLDIASDCLWYVSGFYNSLCHFNALAKYVSQNEFDLEFQKNLSPAYESVYKDAEKEYDNAGNSIYKFIWKNMTCDNSPYLVDDDGDKPLFHVFGTDMTENGIFHYFVKHFPDVRNEFSNEDVNEKLKKFWEDTKMPDIPRKDWEQLSDDIWDYEMHIRDYDNYLLRNSRVIEKFFKDSGDDEIDREIFSEEFWESYER